MACEEDAEVEDEEVLLEEKVVDEMEMNGIKVTAEYDHWEDELPTYWRTPPREEEVKVEKNEKSKENTESFVMHFWVSKSLISEETLLDGNLVVITMLDLVLN